MSFNVEEPREFDDEEFPLAYLITFRCYGTWLHGDGRGSTDRRRHNVYGTPRLAPQPGLQRAEAGRLNPAPQGLDAARRAAVEGAVREVCGHRGFRLEAVNVRTNHVHVVMGAGRRPEVVLNAFKCYATRKLRQLGLIGPSEKPWSRHGSTLYLWRPRQVELAVDYVLFGQGDELPKLGGR